MNELLARRADGAEIRTGAEAVDWDWLLPALKDSYWARTLDEHHIRISVEHSLSYSLVQSGKQIGFTRLLTDHVRFGWLSDVIIDQKERRTGLGGWLMEEVLGTPVALGLKRIMLSTDDAFGFYERFGFVRLADTSFMEWCPRQSS